MLRRLNLFHSCKWERNDTSNHRINIGFYPGSEKRRRKKVDINSSQGLLFTV